MWLYDKIPEDKEEYWKMHKEYSKLMKKKKNQMISNPTKILDKKDELYSIFDEMERNMIMPEGWSKEQKDKINEELSKPMDFSTNWGNFKKKIYNKTKQKINKFKKKD